MEELDRKTNILLLGNLFLLYIMVFISFILVFSKKDSEALIMTGLFSKQFKRLIAL